MQLPAMGYGLCYEYGMFKQTIRDGWQEERPDHWLRRPDPWQVLRPQERVEVNLNCSFKITGGSLRAEMGKPSRLLGIPRDLPIVGYGGKTINSLRLWAASSPDYFDFQEFSHGDFVGALAEKLAAETLTRVLYPDDSTSLGQGLRFVQEYFLVACSLGDIVRRFRRDNADWSALPDKVAIQLNDTHPTMAVPELMRILLDVAQAGMGRSMGSNPEELWPTPTILCCPRHWRNGRSSGLKCSYRVSLEIIFEINRRLLDDFEGSLLKRRGSHRARMSLIEEGPTNTCAWLIWPSSDHTAPTAWPQFILNCCEPQPSKIWPIPFLSVLIIRPTGLPRGDGCYSQIPRWHAQLLMRSATAGSPI